jgi:hypothetical protein
VVVHSYTAPKSSVIELLLITSYYSRIKDQYDEFHINREAQPTEVEYPLRNQGSRFQATKIELPSECNKDYIS